MHLKCYRAFGRIVQIHHKGKTIKKRVNVFTVGRIYIINEMDDQLCVYNGGRSGAIFLNRSDLIHHFNYKRVDGRKSQDTILPKEET